MRLLFALMLLGAAIVLLEASIGTTSFGEVARSFPRDESASLLDSLALPVLAFVIGILAWPRRRTKNPKKQPVADKSALIVDAPIDDPADDLLERSAYIELVEDVVLNSNPESAVVLAVDGEWGTGKTSALNLLSARLITSRGVSIARFDPWHYESFPVLLEALLSSLADAPPPRRPWAHAVTQRLPFSAWNRYRRAMRTAKHELLGQPFRELRVNLIWVSFALGLRRSDPIAGSLERAGRALSESHTRVVLLTEDLDRLTQEQTRRFFNLLFSLRRVSGLVVLLPLDMNRTAAILENDAHLLERLIDLPIPLPAYEAERIHEFVMEGMRDSFEKHSVELSAQQEAELAEKFRSAIAPWCTNLRRAKHLHNAIDIALSLSKGELNAVDVFVLEALRLSEPTAYAVMPNYGDALTAAPTPRMFLPSKQSDELRRELVNEWLKKGSPHLVALADALFPGLEAFARRGSKPYLSYEQESEGRIASWINFDRYFLYRPSSSDVPYAAVDAVVTASGAGTGSATEALRGLLEEHGRKGRHVFNRLMHRSQGVRGDGAVSLGVAVARLSAVISNDGDPLLGTPMARARVLLYQLLNRVDEPSEVAANWIRESSSLEFAAEIIGYLRQDTNHVFQGWDSLDLDRLRDALSERSLSEPFELPKQPIPARVLLALGPTHAGALVTILLDSGISADEVIGWYKTRRVGPFEDESTERFLDGSFIRRTLPADVVARLADASESETDRAAILASSVYDEADPLP